MRLVRAFLPMVLVLGAAVGLVQGGDSNRLTYLDDCDPYYVHRKFPKLITPQWVGEEGVEAVVILGIDDMKDVRKNEGFLRPILDRLKKIDGRAPVSIMTCNVDPKEKQLQDWLKEGLSLEVHTIDHPCPLWQKGDFKKAKSTVDRCTDLMASIPNNKPVAFRMPCCDSLNTPSPRFWTEIFSKTTEKGNFLTIDSSVFNIFTANDPDLPRELVLQEDGRERFRKYIPAGQSFVNTIEDYPYPYVINRLCWEFPCVTPSDWQAQNLHKPNNPDTVRDLKAALDCTVIKQGVFCMVFHPHGWIKSEQMVELIDHAVKKHGKKVKFLTFKEAQERLNKNMLAGQPLRNEKGLGNGIVIGDLNGDRYMDVIIDNKNVKHTTRTWVPEKGGGSWKVAADPRASTTMSDTSKEWKVYKAIRLGGQNAVIANTDKLQAVYLDSQEKKLPDLAPFGLPPGLKLGDGQKDNGLRFVDIDEDGSDDIVFSNDKEYGIYLFKDMKEGWSRKVMAGKRDDKNALPMIATNGTNNGFFVHSRHLWWQNEHTASLPNHVDRRSFNELLANVEPTAKSAEASLRCMKARPGFEVQLAAAEPLVQSPIAFAWGPDGKLWVVEMGDYPLGIDGKGKPGGKIKYLESSKNDGTYDKATVFMEGLGFPTGVLPWGKGVIVTCAPDIFYAEDTKGTGKADKKEVLYTGFVEGNQQHRVNSLVLGLDNWIYCANGDSGGNIKSVKTGKTVNINGRDFRIRPDTGDLDAQTGMTQYGRSRDDWGNWFGCNNANPMYHFVLEDHYLRRNPHVKAPDARVNVSVVPGVSRVYPTSRTLPRPNFPGHANHFTSACSAIVYRDDLFGPAFANNTFVSEPVHNLVHREVMKPEGVTFKSARAADEQQSEFLTSSDNWFRPTMIQTGPDGALWIADMYRHIIEHPQWIPDEWKTKYDLRAGHDKGRIYRVFPVGAKPRRIPNLSYDTAKLVAALDSPSGWQRDQAQLLLIQKKDKKAVPLLEKLAKESKRPLARLHALCTLDGLDALKPETIVSALNDTEPSVRRHAVRLAEPKLAAAPALQDEISKMIFHEEDPSVLMQVAYALGAWEEVKAAIDLGTMAVRKSGDRYQLAALMSSVNKKNVAFVAQTLVESDRHNPILYGYLLRTAIGFDDKTAQASLLSSVAEREEGKYAAWQWTALVNLLDALDERNSSLALIRDGGDDDVKAAVKKVNAMFATARKTVADKQATAAERLQAVKLLGRGTNQQGDDLKLLASLLSPQSANDLQAAALATLGNLRESQAAPTMLTGWKGYGPALRAQVLDSLLRRDDSVKTLLAAIEKKEILALEIDAVKRKRLLEHKNKEIRDRAAKLFAGAVDADRQKVVDAYKPALTLKGDTTRGLAVFTKNCATCHQLGGVGHHVGPDLNSVGDKSPEGLLIAIMDPNRAIESKYINYTALTKAGVTHTGILSAETGTSITLLAPDGKSQVILRTDLDELASTGKSAMPEGLEKEIKQQDLADVIAFVRSALPVPQRRVFDGNKPELVKPEADGSITLQATQCEIYGKTIAFAPHLKCLAFWQSQEDHAVWLVDVKQAGKYTVTFDFACAADCAGNRWIMESGTSKLTGKVASTGSFDKYEQAKVGEIELKAGPQTLTMRPEGPVTGASMIDLKSVKLIPAGK